MLNFRKSALANFARPWLRIQTALNSAEAQPAEKEACKQRQPPCDSVRCLPQPRVVIIGAGMAGLSAAARLTQNGLTNFIVLEAYERPGGRINSCWMGDIVAELGAHWQPENYFNHPIYELGAREIPPRPGVPASEHPKGLFNRAISGRIGFPATVTAYYKFRQIEQEAAELFCLGGNKQHGSMINFISLRIQQELHEIPEEFQHDVARIMFGLVHMMKAKCGDDTALLSCDQDGCFMRLPGGEVRVPLGLMGTLAPILRDIPEGNIAYCKSVSCVYWGTCQKAGCRALVSTSDGYEYPADYVIVTVSLGVLFNNHMKMFCPALPGTKIDAMRCLGYGACNKIYIEYGRPFWFWHRDILNFDFSNGELCGQLDWTQGLTRIEVVPHSRHVLCAFVCGDNATAMEWLCDVDVAQSITEVLRTITNNPNIPYPMRILRSSWSLDPFFCGAFSYDKSNSNGSSQIELATSVPGPTEPSPPILLFAGEATVPGHYATVGGARISGIREAERVCELTIRFKGPPLPPCLPCIRVGESYEPADETCDNVCKQITTTHDQKPCAY